MAFNTNIYNVVWKRLVTWLIPGFLRKDVNVHWLLALMYPLIQLHSSFLLYRERKLYELSITPQVASLESALNDRYDRQERRIVIENAIIYDPVIFYQQEELKPVKYWQKEEGIPVVYFQKEEVGMFSTDFVILIPVLVPFDLNELTAFVNVYKRDDKTFRVQII